MWQSTIRRRYSGCALVAALFVSSPGLALASSPTLHCIITRADTEGEWVATRSVSERNGVIEESRDTYDWEPRERIEFAPGMTLRWSLNYIWPVTVKDQTEIPPEDVTVDLSFRFDRARIGRDLKRPDRTSLHLYRVWNEERGPSATASSLSDLMLWIQSGDGRLTGRSVLTYDTLMAFSTSKNALAWWIRPADDRSGTGLGQIWGLLPVADVRGRIDEIPDLRKRLDRHAAEYEKHCQPSVTVSY